jgi:hypothetical protein
MNPSNEANELRVQTLPVGFVPQPTKAYAEHARRAVRGKSAPTAAPPPSAGPTPVPRISGARVLMWKQDPTVQEIGVRKAFLPKRIFTGPKDSRLAIQGLAPVVPNVAGDLIIDPATDPDAFDAVHTFAVVRQTLTMYERFRSPTTVPWQWNSPANTDPLAIYPHAGVTMNAYYSRSQKALRFFYFEDTTKPAPFPTVYTCRSLDIVAHEAGHAILDGLKPGWLSIGNPPQTGGLHESFGDLTAIFVTLSQLDQVEAIIAQTKANLHAKNFLADVAEQFGDALGRPNGLRNADNDLKLSEVGTEVHAISQVFTGGIFDVLADVFAFERRPAKRDDAAVLYEVGQYMSGLVFRSLAAAPATGATFAHVVNKMLQFVGADGKPAQYKTFIKNRFALREVITTAAAELAAHEDMEVAPLIMDADDAIQDRSGCCGTMQKAEYLGDEEGFLGEVAELQAALSADEAASDSAPTRGRAKARH